MLVSLLLSWVCSRKPGALSSFLTSSAHDLCPHHGMNVGFMEGERRGPAFEWVVTLGHIGIWHWKECLPCIQWLSIEMFWMNTALLIIFSANSLCLCNIYCCKGGLYVILFDPHTDSVRAVPLSLFPFYRWGNWGTEQLSTLLRSQSLSWPGHGAGKWQREFMTWAICWQNLRFKPLHFTVFIKRK